MIRLSVYLVILSFLACTSRESIIEPITITLDSGLMIEDVVVGTGDPVDSLAFVTLHYSGYLADSSLFETRAADDVPLTIQLTRENMISGWFIGIQGMRKGGIRRLVVPPHLAYGTIGIQGIIPPDATLRFDIELHDWQEVPSQWELESGEWVTQSNGLRFGIHRNGKGRKPAPGDRLTLHYSGYLEDGRIFDSSVYRGQPFEIIIGKGTLIPGWESTLLDMIPGERRTVYIPPTLAFGEAGYAHRIPPNATIRFDIELIRSESP